MKKNVLILFAFVGLLIACNNSQKKVEKDGSEEPVTLTVNDFLTKAGDYVGQEIVIKGTVSHTCRNGGKRMFIFDDSEDNRVKIEASESVPSFDVSLEGSDIQVSGMIQELIIDEAYLSEWEQELNEENDTEAESDTTVVGNHEGGGLGAAADQGTHLPVMETIAEYRKQIAESGKDHLSFYSVECISFEVISNDTIK